MMKEPTAVAILDIKPPTDSFGASLVVQPIKHVADVAANLRRLRRFMVCVGYFHERKSGAKVSSAGIEVFDGEPVNLGNNGFRDSSSAMLCKLSEIVYNVRLVSNLNGLFFVKATEKLVGCHATVSKKRPTRNCRPSDRILVV
jgi:hypothetical protein